MSRREYPRISGMKQLPKVNYCPCGKVATYVVTVEVNWMRSEDEDVYRCDEHKRSITVSTKPEGTQ